MELEPEPKLWTKVESEPKINNFGSATLLECWYVEMKVDVFKDVLMWLGTRWRERGRVEVAESEPIFISTEPTKRWF